MARGTHTQFIQRLQLQIHHPLHGWLGDGDNACAGEVLAQQHTEHGGRGRVVPEHAGQLEPGMSRIGSQQQLHRPLSAPEREDDLIPGRLIDLIHPGIHHAGLQLLHHSAQTYGIKRHGHPPP